MVAAQLPVHTVAQVGAILVVAAVQAAIQHIQVFAPAVMVALA